MKLTTAIFTMLAGLAAGLGMYERMSWQRQRHPVKATLPGTKVKAETEKSPAAAPTRLGVSMPLVSVQNGKSKSGQAAATRTAGGHALDASELNVAPSMSPPTVSQEDLLARAQRVEQEANHELRRLVPLLGLNEQQQDQVFAALASRSSSFVPGMRTTSQIGASESTGPSATEAAPIPTFSVVDDPGASTAAGSLMGSEGSAETPRTEPIDLASTNGATPDVEDLTAALLPYLTDEQASTLAADESDQTAWWAEVVSDLMTNTGVTIPEIDGATSTTGSTISDDRPTTLEDDRPTSLEDDRPTTLEDDRPDSLSE